MIYETNHIWTAEMKWKWRVQTGSNPVEVLNFFQASLRNCINCVHCEDHFFIFKLKQCWSSYVLYLLVSYIFSFKSNSFQCISEGGLSFRYFEQQQFAVCPLSIISEGKLIIEFIFCLQEEIGPGKLDRLISEGRAYNWQFSSICSENSVPAK